MQYGLGLSYGMVWIDVRCVEVGDLNDQDMDSMPWALGEIELFFCFAVWCREYQPAYKKVELDLQLSGH